MQRYNTDSGRYYKIGEREYPSVTNILGILDKPALRNWIATTERQMVSAAAVNIYTELPVGARLSRIAYMETLKNRLGKEKAWAKELAKAGEIGTAVHKIIEWNLRREMGQITPKPPDGGPKVLHAYSAFESWRQTVDFKPLHMEQTVWSDTYHYAGTLDVLAELDGEQVVVDFKTGKAVYKEAKLQVAAYAHALKEMGHGEPKAGLILRLPKIESDPNFEAVRVDNLDEYLQAFVHVKEAWAWCTAQDEIDKASYRQRKQA